MFALSVLTAALIAQSGVKPLPALPSTEPPKLPSAGEVVATVNGVPIKAGEVEPLVWQIYHSQIEQDFVQYQTLKQAADAAKVTVTDDEVNQRLAQLYDQMSHTVPPGKTIDDLLAARSYSGARLFLHMKSLLFLEKIDLLDFKPKDWIKVATLEFLTPGKKPDVMKTEGAKAQDAYAQLQKGGSWHALLTSLTTDPNVLKNDGDIGWRSLDAFPAGARDELVQLKVGEFSKPVETANAIEIFKIEARGAEVTGTELDDLRKRFLSQTEGQTFKSIQAKTKVVYTKGQ